MHRLILRFLPLDPQREPHYAGQLQAVHVINVVVRWLLIPVEAVLVLWLFVLVAALLGWGAWSIAWLLRRATAAWTGRHLQR